MTNRSAGAFPEPLSDLSSIIAIHLDSSIHHSYTGSTLKNIPSRPVNSDIKIRVQAGDFASNHVFKLQVRLYSGLFPPSLIHHTVGRQTGFPRLGFLIRIAIGTSETRGMSIDIDIITIINLIRIVSPLGPGHRSSYVLVMR